MFVAVALAIRFVLWIAIGYLNNMGWSSRFGWEEFFVTLFTVAIAYAVAFKIWKTKLAWLIAAGTCVLVANLVLFRYQATLGFDLGRRAIDTVEWTVVGSIAGLVAMLVPENPPPGPKKKSTYY